MGTAKFDYWRSPEGLLLLEGWARDGLSHAQIAHNCGCSKSTLTEWKRRFPEIAEALRKGCEVVDYEVENAMLKRALGYDYTETRMESGEEEKLVRTEKHMPAHVGAQRFWLSHRRPERWSGAAAKKEGTDEAPQTGCVILPEVEDDA